ncbi:unnamed protein product [Orchesella dallaii]|uniref:Gustatory receptor n=1 Tax=Orchesella dallaii TaxID=48710 RepID=A0ABP1R2F2_9HEXA
MSMQTKEQSNSNIKFHNFDGSITMDKSDSDINNINNCNNSVSQKKENQVRQKLQNIISISVCPSTYLGFLPLSYGKGGQFSLTFSSLLGICVRILLSVCSSFLHTHLKQLYYSLVPMISITAYYVEIFKANSCFLSDLASGIDLIYRRNAIQKFHEKLEAVLSDMEIIQDPENTEKDPFLKKLASAKRLRNFIFSLFGFQSIKAVIGFILLIFLREDIMKSNDWTLYLLPFSTAFWKISDTGNVAENFLANSCTLADTITLLNLLYKRKSIEKIHNQLLECLTEILRDNENDEFSSACKSVKRLRAFIVFPFVTQTMIATVGIFFFILPREDVIAVSDWTIYLLPITTVFWFTSTLLRLIPSIWAICLIHSFRIGILGIKKEVEKSIEEKTSDIQLALQNYIKVEKLVREFNRTFGGFIVVSLLAVIVNISMNTFMAIFYYQLAEKANQEFVQGLDFVFKGVTNIVLLYYMCSSGTLMEQEAKDCAVFIHDVIACPLNYLEPRVTQESILHLYKVAIDPIKISPGSFFNLNFKALTKIGGAITMYLLVLVQFHTSEYRNTGCQN